MRTDYTNQILQNMKDQNERKSRFIQTLNDSKKSKDNRPFTDAELNLYFEALIYIFDKIDYSDCVQKLKVKGIDRLLLLHNGVFLMKDKKLMLSHLYYMWSQGEREFSQIKIQGLVGLVLEIMVLVPEDQVQTLMDQLT